MNADLIEILGRPSFTCALLAQVLRNGGLTIKKKAEHEQAAVIHFVLCQYLAHGPKWREAATSAFQAIAAQQGRWEVQLEYEPSFSATQVPQQGEA